MSLVVAQGLSLSYGKKVLLDHADLSIGPRDRIGLVGANGTGKSSLLRLLAGVTTPDGGSFTFRRGSRVGYLPQELTGLAEGTLLESVLQAVPGRTTLETRLQSTEDALAAATTSEEQLELSQMLSDLHAEAEGFEERYGPHRAERILKGLGFTQDALHRPTAALSGGWRMRGALAALLLQDPDLLLLDEPTNHLDIPTLAWFDAFLASSTKARVLISHDRDFLNRQIDRVLSLEPEGLRSYTGDYEDYRAQREQEEEQLQAAADRQAARRAEVEAFADRFGAKATKARQVQSRLKLLEKEEQIVVREKRATVHFRFPPAPRSPREVVALEEVDKAFGERVVYRGLSARVERGQRIAVVGSNGAGKTTLLKLIAGELSPERGEVKRGQGVVMGYYAQHHAERLDRNATLLQELERIPGSRSPAELRSVLGAFLFSGDDVDKKVGVLSGGERARVALAKLLLVPSNFLLMDEPTNHLDLDSSERLIEALRAYEGTLLFVSHNRSFVNQLATEVWDVKQESVVRYPGNLDEYLQRLAREARETASAEPGVREAKAGASRNERDRKRDEAAQRQKRSAVEGPLRKALAQVEQRIALLEREQQEAELQLADPAVCADFTRLKPVTDAHRERAEALKELYQRWERTEAALAEAIPGG